MHKRKLLIPLCLAALIILALTFVFPSQAETYTVDSGTCGENLTWTLDDAGLLTISGTGAMADYTGDYIGNSDTPWGTSVTKVIIEDGVTGIGKWAFGCCSNLTSVTISNTVTSINGYAFWKCSSLTSIVIPDSVTSIGYEAFYNCGLTAVELGKGLTSIGYGAFRYACFSDIVIPDSVTAIGETAFSDSETITGITLGIGVKSIGRYAFYGCKQLANVYYRGSEDDRATISVSSQNTPLTNATWHYNRCIGSQEHTYSAYCDASCNGCGLVRDVTHTYDDLYDKYCNVCTALREKPTGTTGECTWTLDGKALTISGNGSMGNYSNYSPAPWGRGISSVVVKEGVTTIGVCAFDNCLDLRSAQLGSSIISIGKDAFRCCISLGGISIPDGVKEIGASAFEMTGLDGVYIPASVTSIGDGAFCLCDRLTGIGVNKNNTAYSSDDSGVLFDKNKTVLIQAHRDISGHYVIPSGVITVEEYAFYRCNEMTAVTIPASVTVIEGDAFDCDSLQDVYYQGDETQQKKINIGYNSDLTDAQWHFNICNGTAQHVFEWVTDVEPTCAEEGSKHEACTACGHARNENTSIAATGDHIYTDACDDSCDVCGQTRTAPHNYEWVIDQQNTCGTDGVKHEECSFCHIKKNENTAIPATGNHTYAWVIDREATCGADGVKHEECSLCHIKKNENTAIPATGNHTYAWVIDREATCGVDGAKHEECNLCHIKENENTAIPATGDHSYTDVCDGSCDGCEQTRTAPHNYEWVIDQQNTCGKDGVKHEECSLCHIKKNENTVIPATGDHSYADVCDDSCDVCGQTRTAPHNYEWVIDRQNTCGADGVKHEECSLCRIKKNENTAIPATGNHTYAWVIDREATCGADGVKHEECSLCHIKKNENTVIPATGDHSYADVCDDSCDGCDQTRTAPHDYEWVIDRQNTCGADGIKHEECSLCHIKKNENTVIPATGDHDFSDAFDEQCNGCFQMYFVITFETKGSTSISPCRIPRDQPCYTLPEDEPDRTGYVFIGWATGGVSNEEYQPGETVTLTESTVFTAVWVKYCATCDGSGKETYSAKCGNCSGKGTVQGSSRCTTCGGDGMYTPTVSVTCTKCNGSGKYTSVCNWCAGSGGYFVYRCSSGHTTTSKYRLYSCSFCGSYSVSEEIRKCGTCGGYGTVDTCSECGGDGLTTGAGTSRKCSSCSGSGYPSVDCAQCVSGYVDSVRTCTDCNGNGVEQSLTPKAPTAQSVDATVVVLNTIANGEYSIDGVHWQESPVFEGLEIGKEYSFYQRYATTEDALASDSSPALVIVPDHTYDHACDAACNGCGYVRLVPDHSFTDYQYNGDATCMADGTKTAKCDHCDATDTQRASNTKLAHSFTQYKYNNDATWEKDGTQTAQCDNPACNATDTVTAPGTKLPHGWVEETGDVWYYYYKGRMITGWLEYGPVWYYFNKDGTMFRGFLYYGDQYYYFNDIGRMHIGWAKYQGNWYYMDANGHRVTGVYTIDGEKNKFDANGVWLGVVREGWIQENNKWCYYENDVRLTGWLEENGNWFYFNPRGEMVTGWLEYGPVWYYFNENGVMLQGFLNYGGHWYYFNDIGRMHIGWAQYRGKWYYMDASGHRVSGQRVIEGKTYLFGDDGAMHTGWHGVTQKVEAPWAQAYLDRIKELEKDNLFFDRMAIVYVDNDEIPELWLSTGGNTCALFSYYNGKVVEEWFSSYGGFRYVEKSGIFATNGGRMGHYYDEVWRLSGGTIKSVAGGYYDEIIRNGAIVGFSYKWEGRTVTETEYYASRDSYFSGDFSTWEWMNYNTLKKTLNELKYVDGTVWYYYEPDGHMAAGWQKIGGKWYYFFGSGEMATGSVVIGGKTYRFDENGICLNP